MKTQLRDLQLRQTDASLASWKAASLTPRPPAGWVRAVRDALGMSGAALARRLGMSTAGLRKLEAAEANEAITLASLRKLAQALDCELQYALVPRTTLAQQLQERAEVVAKAQLSPITHSMALEDQSVQGPWNKLQMDAVVKDLLEGSRRELW
jgi:predicted DNA-binding mobile mystery protein A